MHFHLFSYLGMIEFLSAVILKSSILQAKNKWFLSVFFLNEKRVFSIQLTNYIVKTRVPRVLTKQIPNPTFDWLINQLDCSKSALSQFHTDRSLVRSASVCVWVSYYIISTIIQRVKKSQTCSQQICMGNTNFIHMILKNLQEPSSEIPKAHYGLYRQT